MLNSKKSHKIVDDFVRAAVRARVHKLGFELTDQGEQWLQEQGSFPANQGSPIVSEAIVDILLQQPGYLIKTESEG